MASDGMFLVSDGALVEMTSSRFASEDELQTLLERHPTLLSGRRLGGGVQREWLLIAREQGVPESSDGRDRWSVDHLFVDQDGIPTIVEVKRSTDTRIRREVVGQMLDYAANGVRNWPVDRLREDLARRAGSAEAGDGEVADLLRRAARDDVTPEAFWATVEDNLRAARLRLLFVADVIPAELQRIIEFLNEQMASCEVLGVEIRQYVADGGHQLLAPAVVGQTTEGLRRKSATVSRSFDELLAGSSEAVREVDRRLAVLADGSQWKVTTSRFGRQFRLANGWTAVQLYPGDAGGTVQFMFGGITDNGPPGVAEPLRLELQRIAGKPIGRRQPWVAVESVLARWDDFIAWLSKYLEALAEVDRRVGTGTLVAEEDADAGLDARPSAGLAS